MALPVEGRRVSMRNKPIDRRPQRGINRQNLKPKLAFGLCRRGKHHLLPHANGFDRGARLLASQLAGNRLIEERKGHRDRMRHLHLRRRQTGDRRHAVENLFQREILSAENVSFAGCSAIERDHMHPRYLSHVDEVQPGIDVGGKFFVEKIDDDPAGWRRLGVAWANRCRGIQNHDVLSRLRGL